MSMVGLDIATMMGAALWLPGTEAPRLSSKRLPGDAEELGRPMEAVRQFLADIHVVDPITHLFFEVPILPRPRVENGKPAMKVTAATVYKLCCLAGMAEWFAHKVGAQCRAVEQQSARKHFIGLGTGPSEKLKRMAVEAAQMRGWDPANDHEAEAAGVLDFGLHCFGIAVPWRDSHLFGGALRGEAVG